MVANHSFLFGGRSLKRCLAAATAGVAAMAFAVMGGGYRSTACDGPRH